LCAGLNAHCSLLVYLQDYDCYNRSTAAKCSSIRVANKILNPNMTNSGRQLYATAAVPFAWWKSKTNKRVPLNAAVDLLYIGDVVINTTKSTTEGPENE
jgi:hypothetical protein